LQENRSDNGADAVKDLPDLTGVSMRNLKDLERELGRPIGKILQGLADGDMDSVDADVLAGLVWIRLRRDDPNVTLAEVWEMDLGAFKEPDEKKAPRSPGPQRSTRSPRNSPGRGGAHPSRSGT
jgi:hypothetical protein